MMKLTDKVSTSEDSSLDHRRHPYDKTCFTFYQWNSWRSSKCRPHHTH